MCARVNKVVVVVVLEALEGLECFLNAKYYNMFDSTTLKRNSLHYNEHNTPLH